jgi:glycosyltransferase involved in cell wall biosynthesis
MTLTTSRPTTHVDESTLGELEQALALAEETDTGATNEGAPASTPEARRRTVSVVIPTKNEARNIPHVLAAMPAGYEVVVVDANSSDGTTDLVRELRPEARIIHQVGRGKGDALRLGFAVSTGDIIVTIDADGSADPAEIPLFVAALDEKVDFAKGSRFLEGGGSDDITLIRRLGNKVLAGVVNVLFGTDYTDLCYGYNAFWRWCLPALLPDCNGFEVETLMNVRAARAGLRIREVPSFEHPRLHGVSNLNAVSDGWRVLRTVLSEWLRDAKEPISAEFSVAPSV